MKNLTFQITDRHIIVGQQVTYDEILNGEFNYYLHNNNISVISRTDGKLLSEVFYNRLTSQILYDYYTVHSEIRNNKSIPFFAEPGKHVQR